MLKTYTLSSGTIGGVNQAWNIGPAPQFISFLKLDEGLTSRYKTGVALNEMKNRSFNLWWANEASKTHDKEKDTDIERKWVWSFPWLDWIVWSVTFAVSSVSLYWLIIVVCKCNYKRVFFNTFLMGFLMRKRWPHCRKVNIWKNSSFCSIDQWNSFFLIKQRKNSSFKKIPSFFQLNITLKQLLICNKKVKCISSKCIIWNESASNWYHSSTVLHTFFCFQNFQNLGWQRVAVSLNNYLLKVEG